MSCLLIPFMMVPALAGVPLGLLEDWDIPLSFQMYLAVTGPAGTYRNMIVTFALLGMWFATSDILVRPLMHSYNGCLAYFTLGSTFRHSKVAAEKALLLYSTMYGVIIGFLAVQFKYRACVLAKQKWIKYFDGWNLAIWTIYTFFTGFIWASGVQLSYPEEYTYQYLKNEMMFHYGVNVRNVALYAELAYSEDNKLRWKSVCTLVMFITLLTIQYSICVVCGVIMYRRIQGNMSTFSSQHEKLQKQFFVALLYQVAAPFICFHLPSFFIFVFPYLDMKMSFHSTLVIYGFNIYPLVDSLILLSVVSEYKVAMKKFMKFLVHEWNETIRRDGIPEPSLSVVMTRM
ncbi:hypothetical protein GCK72_019469 [Caenorhabditis remanei]|uniref:Uncharacterized protein n=1 Tax=Caenorhabditis remanei TaxID=31234 RepID=A0A6A5GDV5_CAERE|nr:hypothetical protein GCK72_019469 [Caenorhabditis remanei]KAF1752914.1 hypothetical protein GCK72_019469 [Caenorhabditis remanei]